MHSEIESFKLFALPRDDRKPFGAVVANGELFPFRLRGAAPRYHKHVRTTTDSDSRSFEIRRRSTLELKSFSMRHPARQNPSSHGWGIASEKFLGQHPPHTSTVKVSHLLHCIRVSHPHIGFHTHTSAVKVSHPLLRVRGFTLTPLQLGFHIRSTAFGFHTLTSTVRVSHPLHCIRVSHPGFHTHTQGFTPTPLQLGFHTRSTLFGFHTPTSAVRVSHPLHCIRVSHPHFCSQDFTPTLLQLGFHTRSIAFEFHTYISTVRVSHPLHCIRVSHPHLYSQGFTPAPLYLGFTPTPL
ncbi:hypothetical protein CRG98_006541 [Punica granatum]|uniref:Uncharacterized protein n=1 Tax=Punica granatum TaxID=22663 RepID=A0A2I0KYX3_PUNGR|nr:hypothetical protein CRG98_006541 [Punica granatum]